MKPRFAGLVLLVAAQVSCGCAGGTTGDFTGDAVDCDAVRTESPGDQPALGFSMNEILSATAGGFDVPVRWETPCDAPGKAGKDACAKAAAFVEQWAGRRTTVHVEIVHDGSKAVVHHPTAAQPVCAQHMLIPVGLRLHSDDGLLDESADIEIWSECGMQSSLYLELPLAAANGALAPVNSALPETWSLVADLGFFRDRMWFDVYVAPPGGGGAWVLTSDLPPFGEGTHDLARTRVELQEGSPLPSEGACGSGY